MVYSKLYLEKKSGIWPVVAAVGVNMLLIALLITRSSPLKSRTNGTTPVRLEVVNLSPNQAGVFWETETQEAGWVELMDSSGKNVTRIADERDTADMTSQYVYHYAALKNLRENTEYTFQVAGKKGAYATETGSLYRFRTPKKGNHKYDLKPAYGKVLKPNGKPAEGAIVIVRIKGLAPLLTISKGTGEWLIPLHTLVAQGTGKAADAVSETLKTEVEFLSESRKTSRVATLFGNMGNLATTTVLGTNYSLLAKAGQVLSATDETTGQKGTMTVIYPRENAVIPASRPLIKGQGVPGKEVTVFINSTPQYSYRATVDRNGEWRVLPDKPIGAGSYVVTVTSQDEKNTKMTIRRNFIIAKNGEQVLGEATAAPTLVPTQPAAPTQPAVPSPTSGTAPTIAPSMPVATATGIPPTSAPVYPTEAPTASPPRTGGSLTPLLLMSVSFVIVGAGLMLVF